MLTLKEIWWKARAEAKGNALHLLAALPGRLGDRARAYFLPFFFASLGENCVFRPRFSLANPEKIHIGSNCRFGERVFITGGGGVRIGDWVGMGPDVKIWSVNHRFEDPDRPWKSQGWEQKPVVIEDDVYLGPNVFVMPGVTIGKGAIVSASTVVARAVPPYAMIAGNPARIVGWRRPLARSSKTTESAATESG